MAFEPPILVNMLSLVRSGISRYIPKLIITKANDPHRFHVDPINFGYFANMFRAPKHVTKHSRKALEDKILRQANEIEKEQPGYHPIYGYTAQSQAKRLALLNRNCIHIENHLETVNAKHQIRILDVGCNCGYVSLSLAEKFSNVVGVEIAKNRILLCRDIAAQTESNARFFECDFVEQIENGSDDLENIDVILLLNIVHQFIFQYGLSYVQALIARLANRVDTIFIELAKEEQDVTHNMDHYLPANPEEVFAECEDIEITLLESNPRPLYMLRRKRVRLAHIEFEPSKIEYSLNPDPWISRKYYSSKDSFTKVFRFNKVQDTKAFRREVKALLRMRHLNCAPVIYDWVLTPDFGAVIMSNIHGQMLEQRINSPQFQNYKSRYQVTSEYIRIAKQTFNCIGYQNDMQPHNLIISKSKKFTLVDYEQADRNPVNDPFGILLWTLFDIWGGKNPARPAAIRSLRLRLNGYNGTRARGAIYPDFSNLELDENITALVTDAMVHEDWGTFLKEWNKKLSPHPPL